MDHPALNGKFLQPAVWLALIGVAILLLCSDPDRELANFAAVGWIFGLFLLGISLIYFALDAVSHLLYHQELLRSKLRDPEPQEGE